MKKNLGKNFVRVSSSLWKNSFEKKKRQWEQEYPFKLNISYFYYKSK